MNYTAYNKQCRLTLNMMFPGQYELRSEYQKEGVWTYILGPTLFESNMTTKEDTDDEYVKALDAINEKMAAMFGEEPAEPESGSERILWLMDNKTFVENNELKYRA